jgi:hypothetical protein
MALAVGEVVRTLVFPLVVLLAGAAVSGLLIPAIARRREDHRKALEIKTELVGGISEVVTKFMMAIQFATLRAVSQEQEDYDEAYKAWMIDSTVIGTKLNVYFPDDPIGSRWFAFTERVESFYALTGVHDPERLEGQTRALLARYSLEAPDEVISVTGDVPAVDTRTWTLLRDAIGAEKSALIREVLRSPMPAFE